MRTLSLDCASQRVCEICVVSEIAMRTLTLLIGVAAGVVFASAEAAAQSAFVEGHVFNKKTGRPIAAAVVQIFENVTAGPIPIKLGEDVTDANGFYEIEVTEFLDFWGRH